MIPLYDTWRMPFSFRELFRYLNRNARWLNGLKISGGYVEHNDDGIIIFPDAAPGYKRFSATSPTAGTLYVFRGAWTRNGTLTTGGDLLELATDSGKDYLTVTGIGAGDFVWIYLKRTESPDEKDAALLPNEIAVGHGAAVPDDTAAFGLYFILGKFTSDVWAQYWTGGDIDDQSIRPDGETASSVEPVRSTLECNATDNEHEGELQLANVDEAEVPGVGSGVGFSASASIPYVSPEYLTGNCALSWMAIDGHRAQFGGSTLPPFNSLYGGGGVLEVGDFSAGTYPRRQANDTYTVMIREMHNSSVGDGYYGTYVRYIDAATLVADAGAYTPSNPPPSQGGITQVDADDRYWIKGADETENYGSAIGDSTLSGSPPSASPVLAIDITNRLLKAADGTTTTLDFSAIGAAVADTAEDAGTLAAGDFDGTDTVDKAAVYATAEAHEAAIKELQDQVNALLAELRTRKIIAT